MEEELRLVVGRLETFAAKVYNGLQEADFQTRREIIRSLVKRVEVDQQHIRIVFRVSPTSVPPSSDRTPHNWQDSGRRVLSRCFPSRHASPQPPRASRPTPGARGSWCQRFAVRQRLRGPVLYYPTPDDRQSRAFYVHRVLHRKTTSIACFSSTRQDWWDTPVQRDCLACSTSPRKLTTFRGAYTYPGPALSQAHSTSPARPRNHPRGDYSSS